jgi:hypothetical protein
MSGAFSEDRWTLTFQPPGRPTRNSTHRGNLGMDIETTALAAAAPTVILADTPYLAVSAGRHAGIPAIVVGNFTWSDVLRCLDATSSEHQHIVRAIERSLCRC